MKIIATLQVDLTRTSIGTRSRLADDLVGEPVLRRTVKRVARMQRVHGIHVLCPADQIKQCKSLLADTQAVIESFDTAPPSWSALVQTARKWSLDSWRGGLGGSSFFDEFTDPRLLDALAEKTEADLILSIHPAAVVFDPELADAMVDYYHSKSDDSKLTFAATPPGLSGVILARPILQELANAGVPLGWVFSYKPNNPQKDLIFQPCCFEVPSDIRFSYGRLVADTDRAIVRLNELLRELPDPGGQAIGKWLRHREVTYVEPLPRELEIELTTDDPYPNNLLRPRGASINARGPIDLNTVAATVTELCRFDDALLILAGFGDPLRHPQFADVLATIRSSASQKNPLFGLAIRTTGVDLSDQQIEAILKHGVDVLEVSLDAWTPETYLRIQSPGNEEQADLAAVLENMDRIGELRPKNGSVHPIVLPEMTKARQNVHELDDFHDGWLRKLGAVSITGASHYGGQREDHSVIRMAPSPRYSCQRINSRCVMLADGRITLCDQDLNGSQSLGSITDASLEELWQSAKFGEVRESHANQDFAVTAVCAACEEWHRP